MKITRKFPGIFNSRMLIGTLLFGFAFALLEYQIYKIQNLQQLSINPIKKSSSERPLSHLDGDHGIDSLFQFSSNKNTISKWSSLRPVLFGLRASFPIEKSRSTAALEGKEAEVNHYPIVMYNRIAKTGSTTFLHLIYALTKRNKFFAAHINITKNSLKMSLADQYDMVQNISTWKEKQPIFYHGHFAYVSFGQFGFVDPIYINLLRDPLDRMISHYYFLRYGDDFRKDKRRIKQDDKTTFDECIVQKKYDCQPDRLWFQIPLLCGQMSECWKVGSQWAFTEAKKNLLTKFTLVGVTEKLEDFLVILEATLPKMFDGLTASYKKGKSTNLRKTRHKDMPSNRTVAALKKTKIYKMERELYDLALKQFNYVYQLSTYSDGTGNLRPYTDKRYRYEKFYGPKGAIIK